MSGPPPAAGVLPAGPKVSPGWSGAQSRSRGVGQARISAGAGGTKPVHEHPLAKSERQAQAGERSLGAAPRPRLERWIRHHLALERLLRQLEELRGLRRVEVAAADIRLPGAHLDLW